MAHRYSQWYDGEAELLVNGGILTNACCSCGEVHDFKVQINRGATPNKDTVSITVYQKPRLTLWRRKRMKATKEGIYKE